MSIALPTQGQKAQNDKPQPPKTPPAGMLSFPYLCVPELTQVKKLNKLTARLQSPIPDQNSAQ